MKAQLSLWFGPGLLVAVLPLAAQQPPTPIRETAEGRIERLLRELDAPRFQVRDRAMRELRELGDKAVAPLKKALAARRSAEFERRAQILLERFTPVVAKPLGLQDRCHKMWTLQLRVYHGTKALARAIEANAGKKPSRAHRKEAPALGDEQLKAIHEADLAIRMLEAEGSVVAFYEVFTQVRIDMKNVEKRLWVTEVGKVNLDLQQDILDTLWEMIRSLEKRRGAALALAVR
jgi:hypothetical protein